MKKDKRKKEPYSLKGRLMLFIILCWVVPIIAFFSFITVSYRDGIIAKTENLVEDQLENTASYISIRLEDVITLCQSPTYERGWEQAWKKYNNGETDRREYLASINTSMKGKFYQDERFRLYAYYEEGSEEPSCYSSRAGVSRSDYMENVNEQAKKWMDDGSDYPHVEVIDGRIFVMRNLYSTMEYRYFGTMVVELDSTKLLMDISKEQRNATVVFVNEPQECLNMEAVSKYTGQEEFIEKLLAEETDIPNRTMKKIEDKDYSAYLYRQKFDNYQLGVVYLAEKREIYSSLYELYDIAVILVVIFLPILAYVAYFLRKQITDPVNRLIAALKKMEDGNMGIKVAGGKMPNTEFSYLKESIDSMSAQVKELFGYIYDEKLARKDAQILALQAQINPHFLNNTLEMMNWQARMNGDVVVSKMIESLGTVLDYRMNRADVKEIYLSEELQCTDAYFYIMSMRFGQRLQVEKEIDEALLCVKVPPLILQPLVENAIVHGIETTKNGIIGLFIYHDEERMYLKVTNTGKKLTKEEQERIQGILQGDAEKIPEGRGRHTSIGIRNVNERIKLVYGEEYGLSISQTKEGLTVSRIVLPYRPQKESSGKERQEIEAELRGIH